MDSTVARAAPAPSSQGPIQVKWMTTRGIMAFVVPIAGLLIALATRSLVLLDWVHVLSGGTWTGIDISMGFGLATVYDTLARWQEPKSQGD